MAIEWNTVTRFSQAVAIVLFVVVFVLGIYLGMQIEKAKLTSSVSSATASTY